MVSSPLSGRIVKLLVTPGESVKARAVLAELDGQNWKLSTAGDSQRTSGTESVSQVADLGAGRRQDSAIPEIRFIEAKNQVRKDRASLEIARGKWLSLQLPPERLDVLQTPNEPHQQRASSEKSD
ncbi:MAG: hypothetical protein U0936_28115 [Planctomycetaceae bacterium]